MGCGVMATPPGLCSNGKHSTRPTSEQVAVQNIDNQVEYWNRVGLDKPFSHSINFDRLATFVDPEAVLLDYGCGYGRVLESLRERGYQHLIGADPAERLVAEARARLPEAMLQVLTHGPHLELPDASVDGVLLFGVLTCIPTDDGQRAVLSEVSRVLKTGGLLYISDFWLQSDARNVERYESGYVKYGRYGVFELPEGVTLRHHDREWVAELTSGYNVAALDETTVITMNGHHAAGFQWFGHLMNV